MTHTKRLSRGGLFLLSLLCCVLCLACAASAEDVLYAANLAELQALIGHMEPSADHPDDAHDDVIVTGSAPDGATIVLTGDITVDDIEVDAVSRATVKAVIPVTRPITIDANGYAFDGGNAFGFFTIEDVVEGEGDAAQVVSSGALTLKNAVMRNANYPKRASAIYVRSAGTSAVLENCLFEGNNADFLGGVIALRRGGSLTATNCAFVGNTTGSNGGAIYIAAKEGCSAVLENCTFVGNTAVLEGGMGGAIYVEGAEDGTGTVAIAGCVFANNADATETGGEVAVSPFAAVSITDSIFAAMDGGNLAQAEGSQVTLEGVNLIPVVHELVMPDAA